MHAGLGEIRIGHLRRMRLGMGEHQVELREAEHEMIIFVDQCDLNRLA